MTLRAVSACTAQPNTPETDKMSEVMHLVALSDGRTVYVMAADPIDAIDKVNKQIN